MQKIGSSRRGKASRKFQYHEKKPPSKLSNKHDPSQHLSNTILPFVLVVFILLAFFFASMKTSSTDSIVESSQMGNLQPVLTSEAIPAVTVSDPEPKMETGDYNAYKFHPSHKFPSYIRDDLLRYMLALASDSSCANKPLFITMGQVQSDLYWQLIENFVFSMSKFGHINCAMLICVSDARCVDQCKENHFPFFDFQHPNATRVGTAWHNQTEIASSTSSSHEPNFSGAMHVMEQVAELKLLHVGRALEAGLNVFLLDLDVGFLRDPMLLMEGFLANPLEHVRAQTDVTTNTDEATNTDFTAPRPNFGVFLVKSHPHSIKAFQRAWREYRKSSLENRARVATDQNAIVGALKWARWRWDYNFSYFSLGFLLDTYPRPILPQKVYLLDKMYKINPRNPVKLELGGEAAAEELGDGVAVHATCHEGSTKLLGLKSCGAFNNPHYYNPARRTITKPLMALSRRQLAEELDALAFLALHSNRSLIVPNVLIGVGATVQGQLTVEECNAQVRQHRQHPHRVSYFCRESLDSDNDLVHRKQDHAAYYKGEYYWPSWRTLFYEGGVGGLEVLEPAYYHRIEVQGIAAPDPEVLTFDLAVTLNDGQVQRRTQGQGEADTADVEAGLSQKTGRGDGGGDDADGGDVSGSARATARLKALLERVQAFKGPRLVLDVTDEGIAPQAPFGPIANRHPANLVAWARDSVGAWGDERSGQVPKPLYVPLPALSPDSRLGDKYRLCRTFLAIPVGNRSCFDKCK